MAARNTSADKEKQRNLHLVGRRAIKARGYKPRRFFFKSSGSY
jgi:hypothetical protein